MSEPVIDDWLDRELRDHAKEPLENWLREDPTHLRQFFSAVTIQEGLYAHYGASSRLSFLSAPRRDRRRAVSALAVAATLALAVIYQLLVTSDLPTGRPSSDPLIWIVSGNPQVVSAKGHDRPQPGPFPTASPPRREHVTYVTTTEHGSVVRWGDTCVLESGPETRVALRSKSDDYAPDGDAHTKAIRSVTFASGTLVVRLTTPDHPVDLVVGANHIIATHPAVFSLESAGPAPVGRVVKLSVTYGRVNVRNADLTIRTVAAGESIALP